MPDILDGNPQINRVLVVMRDQLRVAFVRGVYGDVTAAIPIHDGKPGVLEVQFIRKRREDLTKIIP